MNFVALKPSLGNTCEARIREINLFAQDYFQSQQRHILQYLIGRGLTQETIHEFKLGWVGDHFRSVARRAGFEEADLVAAGFISKTSQGTTRDRFFQRLMFPIYDVAGEISGFAGRTLTKGLPKYLNSCETKLFRKSENLYGIHTALETIGSSGEVVLVEGYMDALLMQQHGFQNTVAVMGSYLSPYQAQLLASVGAARAIVLFDNDQAGFDATQKCLAHDYPIEIFTSTLTGYQDCAEALLTGDQAQVIRALRDKTSAFDARVRHANTPAALFQVLLKEVKKSETLQLEVLQLLNQRL